MSGGLNCFFCKANKAMSFDHAVFCVQNEYLFLKKLYCVNPQSSQNTSHVNIQGVPGGMCQTSGGCSLC